MIRSVVSQIPRISSAAAGTASHGSRAFSVAGNLGSSHQQQQQRPVNRRLEVDFQELSLMLCLQDVTLIDVRQPAELVSQEQIPGSLHIPLGNLREAFQLSSEEWQQKYGVPKPAKHNKAIIFYARGPIASSAAVETAHKLGYTKSRHYYGGWEDYCLKNNLPVTKPRNSDAVETAKTLEDPLQPHYNYHYYNPDLHYL
ncbi:thiosulfate sulfurtransferase/rhodanese-like domain-containing protein 3 isoform X2 [Hyalella azteca]|uniref:Thiosulfate sulfurtransferase/rhodanese-like domain-containing protein 3 isoform X2 n=1 Tax=Hyalella azteca TaxID=294128 RepID=A0A8B7NNK6_HYAAZ|nr:thiosulfate sulfurtransferase/rhodanese-like domain-containing protein 3 isoform X2 [Hyalella azteca]